MNIGKHLRLLYFVICFAAVHAAATESKMRPGATVWTRGTVQSAQALFAPGADVEVHSREREERLARRQGRLSPLKRDALFRRLGIDTKIAALDEFDRDMLMLGARAYTIPELKTDWPMLTEKELRALKREMAKVK